MSTAADPTTPRGIDGSLAARADGGSTLIGRLVTFLVITGAALIVTTAVIHLHLWLTGYRHVPRLGPLFLAQAITGLVGGPLLAVFRRFIAVLAGAGYLASSAGGLILSATVGFVGIHDGLGVPWASASLGVELAGFVVLAVAGALLVRDRLPDGWVPVALRRNEAAGPQ